MARSRDRRLRIGVLASHPIQYLSPLLRRLAEHCELQVFYAHRQTAEEQGEAGYGIAFDWDSDLLSGYESRFLRNVALRPNVHEFDGCNCPEIEGIVERSAFDGFVVTGWYLHAYWQAIASCRKHGVPVMVRGDSQLRTPRSPLRRLFKEFATRWIVAQFDGFLCVGQRNREYLQHYGASDARIFWAPHFADLQFVRDGAHLSHEARLALRSGLGLAADEFVVLFVGRLIALKRPLDLVKAAALLADSSRTVRVVFVGAGPLESDIRALAERLGVRVTMAGFRNQTELPAIYAAADVLALTSEQETWGMVVNEAAACGTPSVVVDEAGCAPDMIVPGRTGATYTSGDVAGLARALEEVAALLRQDDLRPHLAAVSQRHSCAIACERTLAALDTLAGRRRAEPGSSRAMAAP